MIEAILRLAEDAKLDDAKVTRANAAERRGVVRRWPAINDPLHPTVHRLGHLLGSGLPRRITDPAAVDALVRLVSMLQDVAAHSDDRGPWLTFNSAAGRLAAAVEVVPGSGRDGYLTRLSDWQRTPEFYRELVADLSRSHSGDAEIDVMHARFVELARPFLLADHHAALAREHLDEHFREICWALIMVQAFEKVVVPANWPYADRFGEHIDLWVHAVGGHASTAEAFLVFLEKFFGAFASERIVIWLSEIIASTAPKRLPEVWRRTGWMIATLLYTLVTERSNEMSDPPTHSRAVAIAEQLLAEAVSGAGELREALEQIYRR
jgi:hypothetical protein